MGAPSIKLQSLQPSHRPAQMLQLAGVQRHPGAKAELLPQQIVLLYPCPFQQPSQLFQAVRMVHSAFKQFGCVLWIMIMSYSLSKLTTKCDSTPADCSTHPVSWEYLWEVGDLLPKQGKEGKRILSSLFSHLSIRPLTDIPYSREKSHSKSSKSQQHVLQQHICRLLPISLL